MIAKIYSQRWLSGIAREKCGAGKSHCFSLVLDFNILTWLRGIEDKLLHFACFLCIQFSFGNRETKEAKKLYFWRESLSQRECWYIERGLLEKFDILPVRTWLFPGPRYFAAASFRVTWSGDKATSLQSFAICNAGHWLNLRMKLSLEAASVNM